MSEDNPIEFRRVSDTEDAVIIKITHPKCRKCGEKLYGGEVDFGICDGCDHGH